MARKKSNGRLAMSRPARAAGIADGGIATIEPPIQKTKGICGGKARVAGTRIPVWGLENSRRMGLSVTEILERYPSVSKSALKAAWEYAAAHKAEIDRQIRESQELDGRFIRITIPRRG